MVPVLEADRLRANDSSTNEDRYDEEDGDAHNLDSTTGFSTSRKQDQVMEPTRTARTQSLRMLVFQPY